MDADKRRSLKAFVLWVLVTYAAAAIGSISSIQASTFYAQLAQSDWAPPSSVFGPAHCCCHTWFG